MGAGRTPPLLNALRGVGGALHSNKRREKWEEGKKEGKSEKEGKKEKEEKKGGKSSKRDVL